MNWPELPPSVPRAGNALVRLCCRGLLTLAGWKVVLDDFPDEPKLVIVAAPHTSNWDWVIGILTVYGLGLKVTWLGKHTLFKGPLRWLFYRLGGIPVDRTASTGVVEQIISAFGKRQKMIFALAPEGTRSKVAGFRTGYHRIARGANVPLVLAAFDYPGRKVRVTGKFTLTSDCQADTERLQDYYAQFRDSNPPTVD